jgi:hypothetical protein
LRTWGTGPERAGECGDCSGLPLRIDDTERWTWSGDATLNIRDAEIRLSQYGTSRSRSDTGVVPLLALVGEWRFR